MTPSKSARSRRRTPGTRITDSIDSMGALPECASTKLWKKGSGTLWAEKWQAWCVSLQIFKAALNIYIHLQCLQYFNVLHMDQLKKLQGCSSDIFRYLQITWSHKNDSLSSLKVSVQKPKCSQLRYNSQKDQTWVPTLLRHSFLPDLQGWQIEAYGIHYTISYNLYIWACDLLHMEMTLLWKNNEKYAKVLSNER